MDNIDKEPIVMKHKRQRHWIRIWGHKIIKYAHIWSVPILFFIIGYIIRPATVIFQSTTVPPTVDIPLHVKLGESYITRPFTKITITAYSNRVEETSNHPEITASTFSVAEGEIAISQDLYNKKIFPGDFIWIPKLNRWFIVEDCMNARWTRRADIFTYDHKMADSFKIETDIFVVHVVK